LGPSRAAIYFLLAFDGCLDTTAEAGCSAAAAGPPGDTMHRDKMQLLATESVRVRQPLPARHRRPVGGATSFVLTHPVRI
jgi:hypothetical protein